MTLKGIFQVLRPREDVYFTLLEQSAANLVEAGRAIETLANATGDKMEEAARRIKDLEHQGDRITHAIFDKLNRTFLTPIDREDIHGLASALDNALDQLDAAVARMALYRLRQLSEPMKAAMRLFGQAALEVQVAVRGLRQMHKKSDFSAQFQRIHQLEEEGDKSFRQAIADLFHRGGDAIELIKAKDILEGLERALDRTHQIANVIEGIFIKHA